MVWGWATPGESVRVQLGDNQVLVMATPEGEWKAILPAQRASGPFEMTVTGTGMVVVNDIGNLKDIHPANKQEVGRRLANWALAKNYGKTNLVYASPSVRSYTYEDSKIRVTFKSRAGLNSRGGLPITWFELIDADEGGFEPAQAQIEGDSVVLSSEKVPHPAAARFAWSMLAEPTLQNGAGLPVGAFRVGEIPKRDLLNMNVPESKAYQLVYDLDLAKLGPSPVYDIDHAAKITGAFDRVAYFLELTGKDGKTDYLYVSMDAFTDQPNKLGLPVTGSGIHWQRKVSNLHAVTNVKNIPSGTDLTDGNLEIWPNNYSANNSAAIPKASDELYDFGDHPEEGEDGYGSMQVHHPGSGQTLFAVNHWREGNHADVGIGNQPSNQPDWTFSGNAGNYPAKRLRVLVHLK